MSNIRLALAEDHTIVRRGIIALLSVYKDLEVIAEAPNGAELIEQLAESGITPHVCLLDISMPEMNGYETLSVLKERHPETGVIMLSHYDDRAAILKALTAGAKAFLHKEEEPAVLYNAICLVAQGGYFQNKLVSSDMLYKKDHENAIALNETELSFLRYACTDLTYKEIADRMRVRKRTAEDYGKKLMEKLKLKSRTDLALYAIKTGLVSSSGKF